MEELRTDVIQEINPTLEPPKVDERVIAPTEPLDNRESNVAFFELDETISGAGTGFDPEDPAVGKL